MSGQLPGCPLKFEIALTIRQYMFEKVILHTVHMKFYHFVPHKVCHFVLFQYIAAEPIVYYHV